MYGKVLGAVVAVMVLVALCGCLQASGTRMSLAVNGETRVLIALPAEPTAQEQNAAKELANYLKRSTDADFRIVSESELGRDQPAMLVGATRIARSAGVIPEGREAWIIKRSGNRLILAGGRPNGTLYAVWHFLEDVVGVHWWTQWEETVPRRERLEVGLIEMTGNPDLKYRELGGHVSKGMPTLNLIRNRTHINPSHYHGIPIDFGATDRYGLPYFVHTYHSYVSPRNYFATHPEWFSLVDGKRVKRGQLCLTNKELIAHVAKRLRKNIERSRKAAGSKELAPDIFSLSPNDWANPCQCAPCQKIAKREGTEGGPVLWFANTLADMIKDDYGDVFIDTLASYNYYSELPKYLQARDNVVVRMTNLHMNQARPLYHPSNIFFQEKLARWSRMPKHLFLWEYAVSYSDNFMLPYRHPRTIGKNWKYLKEKGFEGAFIEYEYAVLGPNRDLQRWVYAKVLEDVDSDVEKLVKTFTDGYYGPAGPYVMQVLDMLDEEIAKRHIYIAYSLSPGPSAFSHLNLDFLKGADLLYERAEALVADDPVQLRRVRHARLPIDWAIMKRWNFLVRELLRRGAKADSIGLDRQVIATRAVQTMTTMKDLRFPAGVSKSLDRKRVMIEEQKRRMRHLLTLPMTIAPLPDELKPFKDKVTELTAETFRRASLESRSNAKLLRDPHSPTGRAAVINFPSIKDKKRREFYRPTKDNPFRFGIYNKRFKRFQIKKIIPPRKCRAGKYRLYKLPDVKLEYGSYLWITPTWHLQIDLDEAFFGGETEAQISDIYISVRFQGPSFPGGKAEDDDQISVDRVFIVRK